jgi:hypothetical protein
MTTREEQLNNLQEALAFLPERDRLGGLERKLVKAAVGHSNVEFVQAIENLLVVIHSCNPDLEETRKQVRLHANYIVTTVDILAERLRRRSE